MTPFERALRFVLAQEGGYSLDPADPGGETNFGISRRAYPDLDIRGLTIEQAQAIYRRDYWDAAKCEELPGAVALLVFDIAVNQGTDRAIRILQDALGVSIDGKIGPVTLRAAQARPGKELAREITALRCVRYSETKNVARYGRGWFRRAIHCLTTALEFL